MSRTVVLVTGLLGLAASAFAAQGKHTETETPFLCNIKALSPAERAEHQALTARLAESIVETRELENGYAFEIESSRLPVWELAKWTDFERRCCPFFDFNLEWRRERGPLTFRLTGREGVKAFIESEFPKHFR
jgi:hypothetical protein